MTYINEGNSIAELHKLFVYGIFLDADRRERFGMVNAQYDTVKDYLTVGSGIVEAAYAPRLGLALTGLRVDMPSENWPALDSLERGYDRVMVTTTSGVRAYMYTQKGTYGNEN